MKHFSEMSLDELILDGGYDCSCGRHHSVGLRYIKIGRDAVSYLPEAFEKLNVSRPFIVFDPNTKKAAWHKVQPVLDAAGIAYTTFCLNAEHPEPDEYSVGALTMAFDPACDSVMAIGSGVVNDCCKVLAHAVGRVQLTVGTAPSMDGYASNSSSMIQNHVKVSLYNACPAAIIADTMIMKDAPEQMLKAGLGDMLAKFCALCEWRISHLVTGEYYCEEIAELMRQSLRQITAEAPRLLERDPEVIGHIVEGLVLSGIAMSYAQISRPASGLDHYFSHIWEMLALARHEPCDLHGIQVAVGTNLTLDILYRLRDVQPSREAAEKAVNEFDTKHWESEMHRVFGDAAQTLIESENTVWHKNDPVRHKQRLNNVLANWDEILRILNNELPDQNEIKALMQKAALPMWPEDLHINEQDTKDAFVMSREIRDKYLSSSLLWDLGLLYTYPLPEKC